MAAGRDPDGATSGRGVAQGGGEAEGAGSGTAADGDGNTGKAVESAPAL